MTRSVSVPLAGLVMAATLLAAAPVRAQDAHTYLSYSATDAYDPVVYTGIGNRLSNEIRDDAFNLDRVDLGGPTPITAFASAEIGALHVAAHADFGAVATPGDLRSAKFYLGAVWTDSLDFSTASSPQGYAYFSLLVSGSNTATATSGGGASLPFAGSRANIETFGATDPTGKIEDYVAVDTAIVAESRMNWINRGLVTDPGYVGDPEHFDPGLGYYFVDHPVDDVETLAQVEYVYDYVAGTRTDTPLAALAGSYIFRIPYDTRSSTHLQVVINCSALGGALPGDSASADCDLGNSVYWGGITRLTDRAGGSVASWSVTSASGFDYAKSFFNQPTGGVPEPASWALFVVGFGLIGAMVRRCGRVEVARVSG